MKSFGKKAVVLNNKENIHSFKKGTEVIFIKSTDPGLYLFENPETNIRQYLKEENFKWTD